MENEHALKFPIGEALIPDIFDAAQVRAYVEEIAAFPAKLTAAVRGAPPAKLKNTYRPGGWTALQVIHHTADSHVNSYCRFKLALTEDHPTIKPYEEDRWALLPDYGEDLLGEAFDLIRSLHAKWVRVLSRLTEEQWRRTYYHPGSGKTFTLYQAAALYDWHCRHHLRHVEIALAR